MTEYGGSDRPETPPIWVCDGLISAAQAGKRALQVESGRHLQTVTSSQNGDYLYVYICTYKCVYVYICVCTYI